MTTFEEYDILVKTNSRLRNEIATAKAELITIKNKCLDVVNKTDPHVNKISFIGGMYSLANQILEIIKDI
jgi:hypothetical protein